MVKRQRIGVVTVLYNSEKVIDDFIASCQKQSGCDYVLYVVDNNSSDRAVDVIKTTAAGVECRFILNSKNLGVAEGNNQGIKAALNDGCAWVLLLNNDTVFDDGLFSGLIDGARKHNASIVVPKMYYFEPSDRIWCAGGTFIKNRGWTALHYGVNQTDCGDFDKDYSIEYSPTCCALISSGLFGRIGFMDERYFVYFDDTDFFFRAYLNKERVYYLGSLSLFHKVSSLTGGGSVVSEFSLRYMTRNRVYFLRKHTQGISRLAWFAHLQLQMLRDLFVSRVDFQGYKVMQRAFSEGLRLNVSG